MHRIALLLLLGNLAFAQDSSKKPHTLREILLEQMHLSHDQKDWYVPVNVAVDGVTAEQAKWTDGHGNHSIGQLVNHLAFWNAWALERFKDEKAAPYTGTNDETFNSFDSKSWSATVARFDSVMKAWEKAIQDADDSKIQATAPQIARLGTHNAYHVGQIIYIRRLQGSWNPENGVK